MLSLILFPLLASFPDRVQTTAYVYARQKKDDVKKGTTTAMMATRLVSSDQCLPSETVRARACEYAALNRALGLATRGENALSILK